MDDELFVGKRILIIGIENQSVLNLKMMLGKTPASLIHVELGKDAIEICKDINPDVIILDYHRPELESYGLIKAIHFLQKERCFLVLTEEAVKADVAFLQMLGCSAVLEKPVNEELLFGTMLKFLKRY